MSPRRATGKLDTASSIGDVLDSSARTVLTTTAWAAHRGHHPATVSVTGCTEAIGNTAAGKRLPLQRADTVVRVLCAQLDGTAIWFRAAALGPGVLPAASSADTGRH
jgi:hypothetical protein